jgi:cystathionine gamma-synthase
VTDPARRQPATAAVRAGICEDSAHGAVIPPIYLSSNYTFAGFDDKRQYDYTRSGNPTRDQLGDAIAHLEHGAGATVTSSGMAAIHLVLALLEPGDLVVAPHDCYGGTYRLLDALSGRGHFDLQFVDQTDAAALATALSQSPRLVMIETPSNPLLRIVDIEAVCRLAHAHGALVVVDNTFLSPALQTPISLGADIVVHSTTKYLNGHSDVVGGVAVAATDALHEQLGWWANCLGLTGSPFDSYLALRGVRTLAARMRVHVENADAIARHLVDHPAVTRVYYPGLQQHPGHDIAARQQRGFGGMLSFELAGGEPQVRAFLDGLQCFSLAESLGGIESLVAHPATMTHAAMAPHARRAAGIGDTLLRLSAGIEDVADLLADIEAALQRAMLSAPSTAASLHTSAVAVG